MHADCISHQVRVALGYARSLEAEGEARGAQDDALRAEGAAAGRGGRGEPGALGGCYPGGARFGSWGSVPPSSPQAGEAECAERPLGGDAISPLNLLNLDGATCTKLEVKRSYRLKAREYHPDKYAGRKSCAEMHFHSLRAAQEAALLICK